MPIDPAEDPEIVGPNGVFSQAEFEGGSRDAREFQKTASVMKLVANGYAGAGTVEFLLDKDYEVHGVVRRASTFNRQRIDHLRKASLGERHLRLHYGDLGDTESLTNILAEVRPDEVYNLAAQSHVGISFSMPTYTGDVSGIGTVRLLEAARQKVPDARFYQASSSELFGKARETPQNEETPFHPRSPYAVAKLYAYWITVNYREAYGLYACNGILFNHESPRRGENFVTRKIAIAAARIKAGLKSELVLGKDLGGRLPTG